MTPRFIRSLAESNKLGITFLAVVGLSYAQIMLGEAYRGGNGKVMLPLVCVYLGLLVWFFRRCQKVSLGQRIEDRKGLGSIIVGAFILILLAFMLGVGAANGFHKRHPKGITTSETLTPGK